MRIIDLAEHAVAAAARCRRGVIARREIRSDDDGIRVAAALIVLQRVAAVLIHDHK
jgi:hypothetical protein